MDQADSVLYNGLMEYSNNFQVKLNFKGLNWMFIYVSL